MLRNLPFFIVVILSVCSCNQPHVNVGEPKLARVAKSPEKVNPKISEVKKPVPVWGYRFIITGDFNGDVKQDTLTEHYFSGITHQETNKFYQHMDYDSLVKLTVEKSPYSFLESSDKTICRLDITSNKQQLGLAYLKNEGDLNGDGNDELSYVVCWADWSNFNSCTIVTWKNGKWKELYSFHIRDWQLPDLPETYNEYGPMGLADKYVVRNDTASQKILLAFNNFKGLIRKKNNGKIQITYTTEDAEVDSTIVDMHKLPRVKGL